MQINKFEDCFFEDHLYRLPNNEKEVGMGKKSCRFFFYRDVFDRCLFYLFIQKRGYEDINVVKTELFLLHPMFFGPVPDGP